MTLPRRHMASCAKCKTGNQVTIYQSINSSYPDLRDRLVNGKLWEWVCEQCSHKNIGIYPLLFHDMRSCYMIQYIDRQTTDDPNILAQMVPSGRELQTFRRLNPAYRFRLCRSLADFVEKVKIADAGLDDRTIEYLKRDFHKAKDIISQSTNEMEKMMAAATSEFRFNRIMEGDSKMIVLSPSPFATSGMMLAFSAEMPFSTYERAALAVNATLPDESASVPEFVIVDFDYITKWFPLEAKASPIPESKPTANTQETSGGKRHGATPAAKAWWKIW